MGGFMFFKRLINALVTIPVLITICCALIIFCAFIGQVMDAIENSRTYGFTEMVTLLALAVVFCVLFLTAVLLGTGIHIVIWTGDGMLWRKVEEGDFLQDKNGQTIHTFSESKLIWRFDNIFKGRKLLCPLPF